MGAFEPVIDEVIDSQFTVVEYKATEAMFVFVYARPLNLVKEPSLALFQRDQDWQYWEDVEQVESKNQLCAVVQKVIRLNPGEYVGYQVQNGHPGYTIWNDNIHYIVSKDNPLRLKVYKMELDQQRSDPAPGNPFPIGAIYMSVDPKDPKEIFGGEWDPIRDRFLLGAGGKYSVNQTGGAEQHAMTSAELVPHNHTLMYNTVRNAYEGRYVKRTSTTTQPWDNYPVTVVDDGLRSVVTQSTGGGVPFSIMPPFVAVFMWKRTA